MGDGCAHFFKKSSLIRSGEMLGISREVRERSRRGCEEGGCGVEIREDER